MVWAAGQAERGRHRVRGKHRPLRLRRCRRQAIRLADGVTARLARTRAGATQEGFFQKISPGVAGKEGGTKFPIAVLPPFQKPRSPETRRPGSGRADTPEAVVDSPDVWIAVAVPVGGAHAVDVEVPRPASQHTRRPCLRPLRVDARRHAVVVAAVPVVHPLPHIPCCCRSPSGSCPRGSTPSRCRQASALPRSTHC